jgi:hypothetical protein
MVIRSRRSVRVIISRSCFAGYLVGLSSVHLSHSRCWPSSGSWDTDSRRALDACGRHQPLRARPTFAVALSVQMVGRSSWLTAASTHRCRQDGIGFGCPCSGMELSAHHCGAASVFCTPVAQRRTASGTVSAMSPPGSRLPWRRCRRQYGSSHGSGAGAGSRPDADYADAAPTTLLPTSPASVRNAERLSWGNGLEGDSRHSL